MVAVAFRTDVRFKRTEITENIGTAEFVIEGRGTDRAFGHDGQGRRNAGRRAVDRVRLFARHRVRIVFPGLRGIGQMQRRHRKAAETGLGFRAAPRRTFVADFAARARRGAGEGTNRRRVVVGFDLKDRVHGLQAFGEDGTRGVFRRRTRVKTRYRGTFEDGGVVAVGNDRAARALLVRFADHAEERLFLLHAVDREFRVENLMAAVFGIGLCEHHQFDVRRITALLRERFHEVGDFIFGQCQPHFAVGFFKRGAAARLHVHHGHGLTRDIGEEHRGIRAVGQNRFRHAVKKALGDRRFFIVRHRARDAVGNAAFDAFHGVDAAVMHDVGRFARPGADRPQARHRQEFGAFGIRLGGIAVVKERFEALNFIRREFARRRHKVHVRGGNRRHAGRSRLQNGQQALRTECREGIAPGELQNYGSIGHVVTTSRKGKTCHPAL